MIINCPDDDGLKIIAVHHHGPSASVSFTVPPNATHVRPIQLREAGILAGWRIEFLAGEEECVS